MVFSNVNVFFSTETPHVQMFQSDRRKQAFKIRSISQFCKRWQNLLNEYPELLRDVQDFGKQAEADGCGQFTGSMLNGMHMVSCLVGNRRMRGY
jgi:hypothetical protein